MRLCFEKLRCCTPASPDPGQHGSSQAWAGAHLIEGRRSTESGQTEKLSLSTLAPHLMAVGCQSRPGGIPLH